MPWAKQKHFEGHAGAIYASAFDGKFIYTGSVDKFVARWDVEKGRQDAFSIRFEQSIYSLAIINTSTLVVGLANGAMHVFDLHQRVEKHFFTQHTKAIFSFGVNEHTYQLYVGDADGNLSIWDTRTYELLIYLPLDVGKIRDIKINSDGSKFVLACQDGTFRVFESGFFNELTTVHAHKGGTTSVHFHPINDNQLITGGKDAFLSMWNIETSELMVSVPAHNYAIYSITSLNEGDFILTASRDKTVKVWDAHLNFLKRLDAKEGGHRHSVNKVGVVSSKEAFSISDDAKIIIWENQSMP